MNERANVFLEIVRTDNPALGADRPPVQVQKHGFVRPAIGTVACPWAGFECAILNSAYVGRLVMLSAWKRSHRRLIRNAHAVKARWSVPQQSARPMNNPVSRHIYAQSAGIAVLKSSSQRPAESLPND